MMERVYWAINCVLQHNVMMKFFNPDNASGDIHKFLYEYTNSFLLPSYI